MKLYILAYGLCFIAIPAIAAETAAAANPSLFFSSAEIAQAQSLAKGIDKPTMPDISLGAVMYVAPNDWVLWLQGQKWTPATVHEDLKVVGVQPDKVHLIWHRPDGGKQDIFLSPHQTFQTNTGKITDSP